MGCKLESMGRNGVGLLCRTEKAQIKPIPHQKCIFLSNWPLNKCNFEQLTQNDGQSKWNGLNFKASLHVTFYGRAYDNVKR